jgi:hypothetical protein
MARKPGETRGRKKGTRFLTANEENFCRYFALDGLDATESYMNAYNTKRREVAKVAACKLKKKPEVAKRIADLQDRLAYKLSWSKAQAEENLTIIVKESMNKGDAKAMSNAINAIKELNKMCGYHAPTKTESLNIEVGARDIDAIMLNLGFKRAGLIEGE